MDREAPSLVAPFVKLFMISVIICSRDDARYQAVSACYQRVLASTPFEIVRISDASSLAEGYNRGMERARGDILLFCHDDIEVIEPDFHQRLVGHLEHADLIGVAGTARLVSGRWDEAGPPYSYGQVVHPNPRSGWLEVAIWSAPFRRISGMQALDGLFLCGRRAIFTALKFDQETFCGFHLYDIDLTYRAFLAGYRLAVCCDLGIIHHSPGKYDQQWPADAQLFHNKHRATLPANPQRPNQVSVIAVRQREELLEVMRPPHWDTFGPAEK